MSKGCAEPMLIVDGPDSWPDLASICVILSVAASPLLLETSSLESMLTTAPAMPAAVIVKFTSPTSLE